MRRVYKPGLPFLGRVQALSTERSVRVRVKVYDNTTAIYSQDVEIAANLGYFAVPAILADSEVITLQVIYLHILFLLILGQIFYIFL